MSYHPPLSEETRNSIIKDLLEGRLDLEEIATKRSVSKGQVSKIAKKQGLSRHGKKRNGLQPKVSNEKPRLPDPIDIETFDPEERLSLIDAALTQLKAILPKSNYPKGMMEWTSALERLLDQRRSEEIPEDDDSERGSCAAAFDRLFGVDVSRTGDKASGNGEGLSDGQS